jgi:hypothetical protein
MKITYRGHSSDLALVLTKYRSTPQMASVGMHTVATASQNARLGVTNNIMRQLPWQSERVDLIRRFAKSRLPPLFRSSGEPR